MPTPPLSITLLSLTALTLTLKMSTLSLHDLLAAHLDRCTAALARGPHCWFWRESDGASIVAGAKIGIWNAAVSFGGTEVGDGEMWWGGERYVLVWEEGEAEDGDEDEFEERGVVWVLHSRDAGERVED